MKIVQVHVNLNISGGVQSFVCYLSNALSKSEDVTVCSVVKPTIDSAYNLRLDESVKKDSLNVEGSGFSFSTICKIYKYFKTCEADVIHLHGFFYYYAIPIILLHDKVKFVYTVHSDADKENTKWDKLILFVKKFCFSNRWVHPITISPESHKSFIQLYKTEAKMILNGILKPTISINDNVISEYKATLNTRVLVHPGRICEEKNQIVLCRVINRLIEEGYDICLLIAGTIQSSLIYKQIEQMMGDRIRFLGERNDIPQLFYNADAFCLPSIWEGLPITLLESLSVGCPSICSPVGGIVNVVKDGFNGVLSKSPEENDYYEAVKRFLDMDSLELIKMKEECVKSFDAYNIYNTAYSHVDYYQSMFDRNNS